jgi:hypothetical protein
VSLKADLFYLFYACSAVGFEYHTEYSGHEVIETSARLWIRKFDTFCTGHYLLLRAARAHFAPGCPGVVVAPFAFLTLVSLALSAIQPAVGHQFRLCQYVWHVHPLSIEFK